MIVRRARIELIPSRRIRSMQTKATAGGHMKSKFASYLHRNTGLFSTVQHAAEHKSYGKTNA